MSGVAGWQVLDGEGRPALAEFDTARVYKEFDKARAAARGEGPGARLVPVEIITSTNDTSVRRGRRSKESEA